MQGTFWRACRARRVNEERRIIGGRHYRGKSIRRVREETLVVQDALGIGSVNTDDMPQGRECITHAEHTVKALYVRYHHLSGGVAQPVIECFWAKQRRERQRNGAKLICGQMSYGCLWTLRQDDADTVSTCDAKPAQHVRELIGARPKFGKRVGADLARVVLIDHGQTGCVIRMAVTHVYTNVKGCWELPAEAV